MKIPTRSVGYVARCLIILLCAAPAFAERSTDSQTISTSGTSTAKISNPTGGMSASFEELISGSPATVSIVIRGCKSGGTCDVLETNTSTTPSQIRTPTISTAYDYFTITPSWTGGTNVSVQINTTLSTARNGTGGGPPSGAAGGSLAGTYPNPSFAAGSVNNAALGSGAVTDDKASLAVKPAVTVIASSNTALSGLLTIDGVTVVDGSIVLAVAQSTGSQNGPWVTHSGAWTRPTWYASGSTTQAPQFLTTLVRLGTAYQGSTWRMTTAGVTIDTTATTWSQTPFVLSSTSVSGLLPAAQIATGLITEDKTSLSVKPSATVVATSNTAVSGLLTIDSVVTADGSIVLATAQSTGAQNGPWVVHSGAWTRPSWYPSAGTSQAIQFSTIFVRLGTVLQGSTWRMTTAAPITIDTTATTWSQTQGTEASLLLADVTTDNVSSSAHGFAPKSPADATKFLNGAAPNAYAAVKDSDLSTSDVTTNDVSASKHGFAPKAPNDASKYLDGTGAYSRPEKVLSAAVGNTDTVSCPSNTTSNFATTYTIPANYLVTNKLLRVTLGLGLTTSASPPTVAFRLSIGGTSVYAPAGGTPSASYTNAPFTVSFYVQGSAAASGSAGVYTHGNPTWSGFSGSAAGISNFTAGSIVGQPVNLATNGTLVIQPILFCSASTAGNSITLEQMIVEALN